MAGAKNLATGFGIEWIKSDPDWAMLFLSAEKADEKDSPSDIEKATFSKFVDASRRMMPGCKCMLCNACRANTTKVKFIDIWHYFVCQTSYMRLVGAI